MVKRMVIVVGLSLGVFWFAQGDGLLRMAADPWLVGVGGWGMVALGFLAVVLAAWWAPRARRSRPTFHPFRPPPLFRVEAHRRGPRR